MSIKVKNYQLNNEAIQAINDLVEMDINATIAFRLTRIIKELSTIVEAKMKTEQKILSKWVEKDENGVPVSVKDENGDIIKDVVNLTDSISFNKEMSDLMNVENELLFDKINFEELGLKTIKIKNILKLDFLFDKIYGTTT